MKTYFIDKWILLQWLYTPKARAIINYSLNAANMVMSSLKKLGNVIFLPRLLKRFMTLSLHYSRVGQLPISHKICKQRFPLWPFLFFFNSNVNKPISCPYVTPTPQCTQRGGWIKKKNACHLFYVCTRGPLCGNMPPGRIHWGGLQWW